MKTVNKTKKPKHKNKQAFHKLINKTNQSLEMLSQYVFTF